MLYGLVVLVNQFYFLLAGVFELLAKFLNLLVLEAIVLCAEGVHVLLV